MHELTMRSVSVDIKFKTSGYDSFKLRASNDLRYIAVMRAILIFILTSAIRQLKCVSENAPENIQQTVN